MAIFQFRYDGEELDKNNLLHYGHNFLMLRAWHTKQKFLILSVCTVNMFPGQGYLAASLPYWLLPIRNPLLVLPQAQLFLSVNIPTVSTASLRDPFVSSVLPDKMLYFHELLAEF